MSKQNQIFADIGREIEAAELHLETIRAEKKRIELEGMYPSIPGESWETKNGQGNYLYMLFKRGNDGRYAGPNGARRVYIGADPAQIENARRLASNRAAFEQLLKHEHALASHIAECRHQLAALRQVSARWPRVDLGTISSARAPSGVPK